MIDVKSAAVILHIVGCRNPLSPFEALGGRLVVAHRPMDEFHSLATLEKQQDHIDCVDLAVQKMSSDEAVGCSPSNYGKQNALNKDSAIAFFRERHGSSHSGH